MQRHRCANPMAHPGLSLAVHFCWVRGLGLGRKRRVGGIWDSEGHRRWITEGHVCYSREPGLFLTGSRWLLKGVQSVLVLGLYLPIQADSDHESGSQQPTLCLLGSIKGVLILPLSPNCEHQTPLFQSLNCSILQWTFQQQNAPSCYTEFLYNSITYWCQNTELN